MSTVTLHHGDALDILATLPAASVHAVVTDPPYGLSNTTPAKVTETLAKWANGERDYVPATTGGFMGNAWDGFVPPPALWDEVLRVLAPGGHLFCFAGTRTLGLMDTSIRMAGFDIRDTAAWINAQGMPKAKGQLKPAHEPIVIARRPFPGSAKANIATHGTGVLRTDDTRIPHRSAADLDESTRKNQHGKYGTPQGTNTVYGDFSMLAPRADYDGTNGRWPTNVLLDEHTAAALDAQSGHSTSRKGKPRASAAPGEGWGMTATGAEYDDAGGASRFFFVAKASTAERPVVNGIAHNTVKPLELMRHLVRLAAEPGQTIVEPFAGSGTTVEAALLEDVNVIAVEREADYIPLIQYRIDRAHTALGVTGAPTEEALF